MSNNRFTFTGLDELRAELRALPADLKAEGATIVIRAAEGAAQEIRGAYQAHHYSGNLASGVSQKLEEAGPFGVRGVVTSAAPHAIIFENGTEARHYITRRGVKHLLGKMPAFHIFIPTMMRWRRKMDDQHKALLIRHGLRVTGIAE